MANKNKQGHHSQAIKLEVGATKGKRRHEYTRAHRGSAAGVARLMALLLPTALAMFAMFQGVQQILVPVQVEAVDAQSKIANLRC